MAVTVKVFGNSGLHLLSKRIDWLNDTIKVALVSSAYTPDQDAHDYWSDIVANEVSGTNYVAGGATLANKTLTYDSATNKAKATNTTDTVWASSTITARYAVIYGSTGNNATSPLIGWVDFGEDKFTENGEFKITWDAAGIWGITTA